MDVYCSQVCIVSNNTVILLIVVGIQKAYCDIHRVNCCTIELKINNLDSYWNDAKLLQSGGSKIIYSCKKS